MMKYHILITSLIITVAIHSLTFDANADEGYVLLVDGAQIYLDLGATNGVEPGSVYQVYETVNGENSPIGSVKIVQVFLDSSVAHVVDEKVAKQIQVANRVVPVIAGESKQEKIVLPAISLGVKPPKIRKNRASTWLSFGVGFALAIGAENAKRRADNAFAMHKKTTEANMRTEALHFKSETERLDRNSKILAGASVSSVIVGSLFLFKKNKNSPVTVSISDDGTPHISMLRINW